MVAYQQQAKESVSSNRFHTTTSVEAVLCMHQGIAMPVYSLCIWTLFMTFTRVQASSLSSLAALILTYFKLWFSTAALLIGCFRSLTSLKGPCN